MAIITFDGQQVQAKTGDKLVDLCHKERTSIMFGCQNGICATCMSRVTKGIENLSKSSEKEKNTLSLFTNDKEFRLVCQCTLDKDGDVDIES